MEVTRVRNWGKRLGLRLGRRRFLKPFELAFAMPVFRVVVVDLRPKSCFLNGMPVMNRHVDQWPTRLSKRCPKLIWEIRIDSFLPGSSDLRVRGSLSALYWLQMSNTIFQAVKKR